MKTKKLIKSLKESASKVEDLLAGILVLLFMTGVGIIGSSVFVVVLALFVDIMTGINIIEEFIKPFFRSILL